MARYKIEQNRDACIGCGACVALCPENWKMMEDGKSAPIKDELDDVGCNQAAANACPVKCIKIVKL